MSREDYAKYYIQGSDHYLIPKDVFIELFEEMSNWKEEAKELKEELDYLRSGEYLNQLRFERDMLQHVVDNSKVSKVDKEFIDMTHRNTELLAQQKLFINYLESESKELIRDAGYHQRICLEILEKYKGIIGGSNENNSI